ncbi:MAG: glycerol-3-phosphate acyltransferase [Candidatus Heimdallarchaeota archaeon]|nr:glycerol-3-phosphate acyltransferase [Candidatus Heimdallarchaeota archaeon]
MDLILQFGMLLLAYLIGSIPFGFIIVKIRTGEDIRDIQSGRTGGTNAMRAAGFLFGLYTGILDVLKGYFSVLIARNFFPDNPWIIILAGVLAIIGHNYSIFLIQRGPNGKLRLGGGAGGATTLGGAIGLWSPSGIIILVICVLIYYFVGYASVTTMMIAFLSIMIFTYRVFIGLDPWQFIVFGVLAQFIVMYSLRPNIKALRNGTERLHGFRARKKKDQN